LIIPNAAEIKINNRARSAKLRIAEKNNSSMKTSLYNILKARFLINDDA
jgi:hypothetical protein